IRNPGGARIAITGRPETFIPLSRPGPEGLRIYTSLGFGIFEMDGRRGAGMFEYSRRSETNLSAQDSEDADSD
ncbi:MAG TPA: hypothetical protein VIX12_09850, partial [Candidatus Binataceae bacterium]